MISIKAKSDITGHHNGKKHVFLNLSLKDEEFQNLKISLINSLSDYYVDPKSIAETLKRLGKNASAQKLLTKLPEVKKLRSGDIGEILATDYIEEYEGYNVPIRKLRWRDHRNMAMRGDDVIGIAVDEQRQTVKFIKAEAKSTQKLSREILEKARAELDLNDGLPAPHALAFVTERLRESNDTSLANLIETAQLVKGIKTNQVKHLLFIFTGSNSLNLQKAAFNDYCGDIKQISVGFRTPRHQMLIECVYQGVIDDLSS